MTSHDLNKMFNYINTNSFIQSSSKSNIMANFSVTTRSLIICITLVTLSLHLCSPANSQEDPFVASIIFMNRLRTPLKYICQNNHGLDSGIRSVDVESEDAWYTEVASIRIPPFRCRLKSGAKKMELSEGFLLTSNRNVYYLVKRNAVYINRVKVRFPGNWSEVDTW